MDPASVREFDRNSSLVHPHLSRRLKLQGRTWRINAAAEFADLVEALESNVPERRINVDDRIERFRDEAQEGMNPLAAAIQHVNPNYDLEHLLERVFESLPHIKAVKRSGGAHDRGADLVVTSRHKVGVLDEVEERKTVVQVKSFEGRLDSLQCVRDIERAFRAHDAQAGLIATTAVEVSPEVIAAIEQLVADSGRPVRLLYGANLVAFVVRHVWEV